MEERQKGTIRTGVGDVTFETKVRVGLRRSEGSMNGNDTLTILGQSLSCASGM